MMFYESRCSLMVKQSPHKARKEVRFLSSAPGIHTPTAVGAIPLAGT